MHQSVMKWVNREVAAFRLADKSVLEVGSYNVNGTVRPLFRGPYWGIDMRAGPCVDEVLDIERYRARPGDPPKVVVCVETLEHVKRPWIALSNMVTAFRGYPGNMLITTRGFGFPLHEYPADYWRFSKASIEVMMYDLGARIMDLRDDPDPGSPGVFCHARFNLPHDHAD